MAANKTFTFEHEGNSYTIPAFSALPVGAIRKARKAKDETDQAFTILEIVLGEDSPEIAAVDKMDASQFEKFLSGWTQGAPMGEPSDS